MDGMVDHVIHQAELVNHVQLILLVMEGVVLCLLCLPYIWYLCMQVSGGLGGRHIFSVSVYRRDSP